MFYEGARFHEQRFKEYGARLADIADLVREGLQIPVDRYDEARRYIAESRRKVAELYKATPVILVPAATGSGAARSGDDRRFADERTVDGARHAGHLHSRCRWQSGLPLGLQLTADHGQDARVIRTAVRLYRHLHPDVPS